MLVHKRIKELVKFTGTKGHREALKKVYVGLDEAVATDGHALVRMPVEKQDKGAYPTPPNTEEITEPVLLDVEVLNKAVGMLPKKATLPILECIQVGKADDKTVINAGSPPVQIPVQDAEGVSYPDYEQVIPDYTDQCPLKFAVDAAHLKRICELAARHGDYIKRITFEIPTTGAERVKRDSEGNPEFDDAGEPIMEREPVIHLESGLKFEVKNENEVMFHGILMPLRMDE